jgi:hypothetical protein
MVMMVFLQIGSRTRLARRIAAVARACCVSSYLTPMVTLNKLQIGDLAAKGASSTAQT